MSSDRDFIIILSRLSFPPPLIFFFFGVTFLISIKEIGTNKRNANVYFQDSICLTFQNVFDWRNIMMLSTSRENRFS